MKMEIQILRGPDDDDEDDDGKRQQINRKVSLLNGIKKEGRKSLFYSYCERDSVLWLRRIALDPRNIGASLEDSRKSFDHILNMRKLMLMDTMGTPLRKRKLGHFLTASTEQIGSKFMKEHLSVHHSESYLLDLVDSGESFNRKVVDDLHSSGSVVTNEEDTVMDKPMNFAEPANKYTFPLVDSDESGNGLNPLIPDNPTHESKPLLDAYDSGQSSYSLPLAEQNYLRFPRLAIPVGPRFQAEVLTYPNNKEKIKPYNGDDSENLRWLGTQVWPVENKSTDIYSEKIGKGRSSSCTCKSPESSDCIKHHVLEKRLDLQAKLAGAFLTWKFDDMGEDVSKSWTLREQKGFSTLRQKYMGDEATFWAQVLKCLPFKCKKTILSYYFNVFIPKRLSIKTKLSSKQIYSDDEEIEEEDDDDNDKKASRRKCKSKSDGSSKPKDVKKRYMRHAR